MTKFMMIALLGCGITVFSASCELFEDPSDMEDSEFYVGDDYYTPAGNASRSTSTASTGTRGRDGYDLDNADNYPDYAGSDVSDESGPSAYEDQVGGDPYVDGFGPRVQEVSFEPVYFNFDQNTIPYSEIVKIDVVVSYLNEHADQGVVIEGNCDERGTSEYNRALGEERAISVKQQLLQQGIGESRIKTLSWGEDKPAVSGSTEDAYRLNRRAEFVPVYLER